MRVPPVEVPKIIWSLWLQGRDAAPGLVHLCLDRWAALNPSYRLEVLDRNRVALLLDGEPGIDLLPPQALSDIARARLLRDHGGIWVDASLFPIRPLDEWLPEILTESGFFAFERPKPDRLIASWFLVSTRQNAVLRAWWKEIERYWATPRQPVPGIPADPVASVAPEGSATTNTYPYFWFHYLFELIVRTDPEAAAVWSNRIGISADLPHRLQFLFVNKPLPSEAEIVSAANAAPVQKLNWRSIYPLETLNSLR